MENTKLRKIFIKKIDKSTHWIRKEYQWIINCFDEAVEEFQIPTEHKGAEK